MIVPLMVKISVGLYIVFARNGLVGSMWEPAIAYAIVVLLLRRRAFVISRLSEPRLPAFGEWRSARRSARTPDPQRFSRLILPPLVPAMVCRRRSSSFVCSSIEAWSQRQAESPRFWVTLPRAAIDGLEPERPRQDHYPIAASSSCSSCLLGLGGWKSGKPPGLVFLPAVLKRLPPLPRITKRAPPLTPASLDLCP